MTTEIRWATYPQMCKQAQILSDRADHCRLDINYGLLDLYAHTLIDHQDVCSDCIELKWKERV